MKKTIDEYYHFPSSWGWLCKCTRCYNYAAAYDFYCNHHLRKWEKYYNKPTIKERIRRMTRTLREKVRSITRSADERALIDTGFTYPSGALTKEGRKVVVDLIFEKDKALKTQVVEVAKKLKAETTKKK